MPTVGDFWYEDAGGNLSQGRLLFNVTVFQAILETVEPEGNVRVSQRSADVVVLTQTCDLPKRVQTTVLVATVYGYDDLARQGGYLAGRDGRKALAEGAVAAQFLLPPTPDGSMPWSVVDFRKLQVLDKDLLASIGSKPGGITLSIPYREHLAQAFARFMMRVGLPSTLDEFKTYLPPQL